MKYPVFSICIPNYNYADYIGMTIESVLKQTYQNFEIIISDNCSTDNSIKIIESFNDDRIKLIKNKYNIGFAPNLQKATMRAKGDFINLLSSDDLMHSRALEVYLDAINSSKQDDKNILIFSNVRHLDKNDNIINEISDNYYSTFLETNYKKKFNCDNGMDAFVYNGKMLLSKTLPTLSNPITFCTAIYSKKLYDDVEGYNAIRTVGPDKFFNYKLLSLDPAVIYLNQSLYDYRVHESPNYINIQQTIKQQIDDYLNVLEFPDELLDELDIKRKNLVDKFLDKVCLKNGLTQLAFGTYKHAFKMLCFCFASFPFATLKRPRTYILMILLLFGPFSRLISKFLYYLYKRFYNK